MTTMLEKLQKALEERDLTQEAVESAARLPKNRIAKWKGGQGRPNAKQALAIARVLGLPVEYLIDDAMDEPPAAVVTEAERRVWDAVAELGPEESYRRLIRKRTSADRPRPAASSSQGRSQFPQGEPRLAAAKKKRSG